MRTETPHLSLKQEWPMTPLGSMSNVWGEIMKPRLLARCLSRLGVAAPLIAIDLMAIKHGDLPTTPLPAMNAKGMVSTDSATIAIQSGNVARHIHPDTKEIQYIIDGSGSMWLGSERKDFPPGKDHTVFVS
jgi:hypothetical protein